MAESAYNVHGTAITAYAISWGLLMKLGERGLLSRQEAVDVLDFALLFLEENAKHFSDQTATDTAAACRTADPNLLAAKHSAATFVWYSITSWLSRGCIFILPNCAANIRRNRRLACSASLGLRRDRPGSRSGLSGDPRATPTPARSGSSRGRLCGDGARTRRGASARRTIRLNSC